MANEESKQMKRPEEPMTRKPPIAFGPQQDGVSPAAAKEIIEGRQRPSKVYRPGKKRQQTNSSGGQQ